jgi:hypothetical protein
MIMDSPDRAVYIKLIRGGSLLGASELYALRARIDKAAAVAEITGLFLGQDGRPPLAPELYPDVQEKIAALLKVGHLESAHQAYRAATGGDDLAARLAVDALKASL